MASSQGIQSKIQTLQPQTGVEIVRKGKGISPASASEFKQALLSRSNLEKPTQSSLAGSDSLRFSNHAVDRMRSRGVSFGPEQLAQIERAVQKAQAKGARETLVLTDESALIVNIKSQTVVTVMDKSSLKENVFTNIDSTVVI